MRPPLSLSYLSVHQHTGKLLLRGQSARHQVRPAEGMPQGPAPYPPTIHSTRQVVGVTSPEREPAPAEPRHQHRGPEFSGLATGTHHDPALEGLAGLEDLEGEEPRAVRERPPVPKSFDELQ